MATSIKIDDELESRIEQLAYQQKRPTEVMVREALAEYLARAETYEAFTHEALASLAEFKQNGKHLTGQEVHNWLDGWGTSGEKDMPECHN